MRTRLIVVVLLAASGLLAGCQTSILKPESGNSATATVEHPIFFGQTHIAVTLDGKTYTGVANLGIKPTFGVHAPLLELHLFDTSQDLYGKRMCVEFIDFIRGEQKFASLADLKSQIANDAEKAKEILSNI